MIGIGAGAAVGILPVGWRFLEVGGRMAGIEDVLRRAVYLTGATASGKTAVGVLLAERLGAEVVAMDSMTLYRGLDVGTAKPLVEERRGVTHHLIDVLEPWESASVAEYRRWAVEVAEGIERRGKRVLFVGGTPLYLKVLLRGLFEGPGADERVRERLVEEGKREGLARLHERLREVDWKTASRLHPNDERRVVRALEVYEMTGRAISEWQAEHDRPAEGVKVVAIERERGELHRRIDTRTEGMFVGGLVEEVERVMEGERGLHRVPAQGAGYREVMDYLAGKIDRSEAVERTKARTRQLAKRQETWFRGLEEVTRVRVETESAEEVADRLARWVQERGTELG